MTTRTAQKTITAVITIGALTLDNTRSNLAEWIRNSQRYKPGNKMPGFALTNTETNALVARAIATEGPLLTEVRDTLTINVSEFFRQADLIDNSDRLLARLDARFTPNDSVFLRYIYNNYDDITVPTVSGESHMFLTGVSASF